MNEHKWNPTDTEGHSMECERCGLHISMYEADNWDEHIDGICTVPDIGDNQSSSQIDTENIVMVEFTRTVAGVPTMEMVALFNKQNISEEEVVSVIKEYREDRNVIIMHKEQYQNVFLKP